jgi:hypothetical protein
MYRPSCPIPSNIVLQQKTCCSHPNTTQKTAQTKKPTHPQPQTWDGKKPTAPIPTKQNNKKQIKNNSKIALFFYCYLKTETQVEPVIWLNLQNLTISLRFSQETLTKTALSSPLQHSLNCKDWCVCSQNISAIKP